MKKYILITLITVFIFAFNVSAFAYTSFSDFLSDTAEDIDNLRHDVNNNMNPSDNAIINVINNLFQGVGFMCDSGYITIQNIKTLLNDLYGTNYDNDDIVRFIDDNVTISDDEIEPSDDFKDFTFQLINQIITESGVYYGNTTDLTSMVTQFSDGAYYNGVKDYCIAHSDKIVLLDNGSKSVCCVDWHSNYAMLQNAYFDGAGQFAYRGYLYDMDTWQNITGSSMSDFMIWDSNAGEFVSATDSFYGFDWIWSTNLQNNYLVPNVYKQMITYNKKVQFKCYRTLSDLQAGSQGIQPYYFNNSVYQDYFNNSNFTITDSSYNGVSYDNCNNHINDSYNQSGNYPTINNLGTWIEEQNNNGSGGSGGSGDDNGGGGSSGDGIFDFLSDLGAVLGNLISNLGSAINNIISGIADLISSIVSELPTVLNDLLSALFDWLPDEWRALLGLSFTCMLIWGVVKIFRG